MITNYKSEWSPPDTILEFAWTNWGKAQNKLEYVEYQPKFLPSTPRMQPRALLLD
jgi:hypothetical protein